MPVSRENVGRVQRCWGTVSSRAMDISNEFYKELFLQFPRYQPLFRTDRKVMIEKLAQMLNILINGMDVWESIEPEIRQLGFRHAHYGDFNEQDYHNVKMTLVAAINKFRAEQSAEVTDAWLAIFTVVADTMQLGAAETQAG